MYSKTEIWGRPKTMDFDPEIPAHELKTFLLAQETFDPDDPHITQDGLYDPHPQAIFDAPLRSATIAAPFHMETASLLDIPDFSDQAKAEALRTGSASGAIDYDTLPEMWDMMAR